MQPPRKYKQKLNDHQLLQFKNPALKISLLQDKFYISQFQERVGYGEPQRSLNQKWACKNCLLGFVGD